MDKELPNVPTKETPLWFSFAAIVVGIGLLVNVFYEHGAGIVILKKGSVEFSRGTNPVMFWVGLCLQMAIGMGIIGVFSSRMLEGWRGKNAHKTT